MALETYWLRLSPLRLARRRAFSTSPAGTVQQSGILVFPVFGRPALRGAVADMRVINMT